MMSQLQIGRIEVRSIETPLTDHCNLKCAGCDHASPHMGASFLDVDSLADDLTVLSSAMKAEEFR
jgi:molybdenum cofactor biosynthesis enzyme MoaA